MSKVKPKLRGPCRLLDFYMQPLQKNQNGAGRECGDSERPPDYTAATENSSIDMEDPADLLSEQLPSPGDRGKRIADSSAHSPDKQPPLKKQHGAGTCSPTAECPVTLPLAAYPTSDNPASEHSIKAMLLSLQADLHRELKVSINQLQDKVTCLEDRTTHIEQHLSEATKAHNTVVHTQDDHSATIQMLRLKVADLEDRSRRNNIKIRGVPESLAPPEIVPYLHQLFRKLIP